MPLDHFSRKQITLYVEGLLDAETASQIEEHMDSGCHQCLGAIAEVTSELAMALPKEVEELEHSYALDTPLNPTEEYDPVFFRLLTGATRRSQDLVTEKIRASGQWASILRLSPAQRLLRISHDPSLYTYGFYERMLESAKEAVFEDPVEAASLATATLRVAERLSPQTYGEKNVIDFQALALATLANCLRIAEDFVGAAETIQAARSLLARGTRDPLEMAYVYSLAASLETNLGHFEDAASTLQRARKIYADAGDSHMVGRMLIQEALAVGYTKPRQGIQLLQAAHRLIDQTKEPRLELCIRHTTAFFLAELGAGEEAFAVVQSSLALYKQFNDRTTRIRRWWLEGKINKAFGNLAEAEHILTKAAEEFLKYRRHQECVLTNIELAEIYFLQGRTEETISVAQTVLHRLSKWGMHEEGLALTMMAVTSLMERKARVELFAGLTQYLRRSWFRPQDLGEADLNVH